METTVTDTATTEHVDIYPVGVLTELLRLRRALTNYDAKATAWAVGRLRTELGHIAGRARAGDWRAVKNAFNGYLAEPTPFPAHMRRCGSGWTKRRAMRSLQRHWLR
jgi:hypothetical protein